MTLVNNYFKVTVHRDFDRFFMFNGNNMEGTAIAYNEARQFAGRVGGVLSVYNPPLYPGEWDHAELVGHRNADAIHMDLRQAQKQLNGSKTSAEAEMAESDVQHAVEELEYRKSRFAHRDLDDPS